MVNGVRVVSRANTRCRVVFAVCIALSITPGTVGAVYVATTSVSLTVCGDAIVSGNEFCDDGTNTGVYADSIAGKHCTPLCSAWGPHCGDGVMQTLYGEECDDSNNTAGDLCDPVCQNEQDPVTEGGGGGSGSTGGGGGRSSGGARGIQGAVTEGSVPFLGETSVIIKGRAYPGATVTVLRDGEVERVVEADGAAQFEFSLTDQTPGITTFGFWAVDRAGRRSVTYAATFQIIQNAVTTLAGILLPPTLAATPEQVPPGGAVTFAGSAVPSATVRAYVDASEAAEETQASKLGEWSIAYDTSPLTAEAQHTVRAHYLDPVNTALKSGYSALTTFYVGTGTPAPGGSADLNGDGLVNLTDFSILLFHWNSTGPMGDINTDGTVSLPDFSIMLYQWTG